MPPRVDPHDCATSALCGDAALARPLSLMAASDEVGIVGWVAANLSTGALVVLAAALVALVALLGYAIVRELRRNKAILDPIEVPSRLAALGYTQEVVAKRLLDALLVMQRAAPPLEDLRGVDDSVVLVDLDVPGTLSLPSFARRLRRLLLLPEARIGGEITQRGADCELLLRIRNGRTVVPIGSRRGHDIAALLQGGAEDILRYVDPWILAHHYFALEGKDPAPTFPRTIATLQALSRQSGQRARPWVLNMLGICHLRQGLPAEAAARFAEAAAAAPNLPLIHQNHAEALLQLGRVEEAQAHRRRALEIPARTANLLANNAILATWLHRPAQAVAFARKALAKAPDNGRAWAAWGYTLFGLHRLDQAAAACERAVALGVRDVYVAVPQALVHAALGNGDRALACAREAIAYDAESREAVKAMGFAHLAAGDPAAAIDCFDRVLLRSPLAGDAAYGKADALFALGRPDKAAEQYAQAVALDSQNPQAWVGWGRALFVLGESDDAEQKFTEAVRIDPAYSRAYREWASALHALGRGSEAEEVARRAADVERRNREPLPIGRKAA
jgi:tetratricopeptide (TPR) repeat protein